MNEPQVWIDRRRFLRGAGATALVALLSACGARTGGSVDELSSTGTKPSLSTSTPTASRTTTPRPTSTVSATPAGVDEAFDSPLHSPLSPTGTESVPPAPTATPTPPPTPFPAGLPTKLGLFVGWYHPQIMDLIETGNVALVKTLELDPNFLSEIKTRSPETLVVGRVTLGQVDLRGGDMRAEARRAAEAVLVAASERGRSDVVDAWEGHNEPVPGDRDEMRRLAELEAERVRVLSDRGLRAVVGNFGTGQPPLEWWPDFRPAVEAAAAQGGYLGLHEYSAPTIWYNTNREALDLSVAAADEGWLTLRYRKVYRQHLIPWGLKLPLLITECGVDGLVGDRPGPPGRGWKDFASHWAELGMGWDTPGNYVEQLAWYDGQLQLDDYVAGAAVFAMTVFQEWESYQLLGDAAAVLQQYLSVHPLR